MTESIDIILAGPRDADALAALAADTFPLACPPNTRPEDIASFIADVLSPASFAEYLADPDRSILLAAEGTQAVGYAMVVLGEPSDEEVRAALTVRPTICLSKFYLRQSAHGNGLAHALMRAVLEQSAERGAAGIWLGVNQQNSRAQAFYRRNGFRAVGVKSFLVGSEIHEDFTMERIL
ncbi:GNAT family N-acetyltransferase [Tomitella biformata]|uniref:GNAT family N-acetyltransferase n=1 Tax=Tomitella biformata TaxID=630403 RepID=UPI0004678DDF|nr:GNAT family N-acetyltransferase [Tomitella biformata]